MALFHFPNDRVVSPELIAAFAEPLKQPIGFATEKMRLAGRRDVSSIVGSLADLDLSNQFIVFQLNNKPQGRSILESSQVIPNIEGTDEDPDVLVSLEMQSFNFGKNENIDKNTRATLRITMCKDESSRDKYFEQVYWSIAAGLNLFDPQRKEAVSGKEFKTDLKKAFGNRPIEIPGGLSKISFEVVKHDEPKWWQQVFRFVQSDAGRSLTSVIGFPAVPQQAFSMVENLLNQLEKTNNEVLFKSLPMRLALSKLAKYDYTGGNERIKIGCLSDGFCILARGRDYQKFVDTDAIYYPSYGRLVPAHVSEPDFLAGNYDDPFAETTYAVFKVRMKKTRIDPAFNFGT